MDFGMTPIELTQDQKDKLLEMAVKLFPESEFSWEYDMYGRVLKSDFNNVFAIYDKNSESHFNIHWFEFCVVKLYPKIQANKPKTIGHAEKLMEEYGFLWDICNYDFTKIHPVDYLYKEFQKLK